MPYVIQSKHTLISKKTGKEVEIVSYFSHVINLGGFGIANSMSGIDKAMKFESGVKARRIMREKFGKRSDMTVIEID